MAKKGERITNPFSSGGGGNTFEREVQAAFVVLMLAEGFAPCLPCRPIQKIKFQGMHKDYQTDDLIVFTADKDGTPAGKLLGQIKHKISITEKSKLFAKVIASAWADFNNGSLFTKEKDVLALITGPLSVTDTEDVRIILDWARYAESSQDFLQKVNTAIFSSNSKRQKLKAFRKHLDKARGASVDDDDLFQFLRHFHLLGYDLDIKSGVMHSILHSLIGQNSHSDPFSTFAVIAREASFANHNAGTITRESAPPELRDAFSKRPVPMIPEAISKTLPPQKVTEWNTSEFGSALVTGNLLGSWNEKSDGDVQILKLLVDGPFDEWQAKLRKVLQLPDSPLILRSGLWGVRNRNELWKRVGASVFDNHLDKLKNAALVVLKERDPRFELPPKDRFAASIYGKVRAYSSSIRKGIAETLALLGSIRDPLVNCSLHRPEEIAASTVRDILSDADWVLWGSINDQLPLLAEASPNEFLGAVNSAMRQDPCPFNELFAQEGSGFP
jgi:hypothetical protein